METEETQVEEIKEEAVPETLQVNVTEEIESEDKMV
jgi:hypothetical protein